MNQLLAIRVFARVVEVLSFTRAAESLDMPKATASKLVSDLEAHLGIRLLQRTTRRLVVTPDGQAYYQRALRLVQELEDVDTDFSGAHVKPRGRVRVDVGGTTARHIVIPALPGFFERYPDIELDLGISDRSVDLVGENVDCVIRGGHLTEVSIVARLIGMASRVTCATPGYLARHGTPAHPDDLSEGHRLIGRLSASSGMIIPARFENNATVLDIDGPYSVRVNESNGFVAAGVSGLGVLCTLRFAVEPYLQSGQLVEILPDWAPTRYPFHVVYPPNRHLSNRVRVVVDWLVELFATVR